MKSKLIRELQNYIDELAFRGRMSVVDLAPDEYGQIIGMLINMGGKWDEFCCITETSESANIMALFIKFLKTENKEDGEDLLDAMRKGSSVYFADTVNDMLRDAYESISHDMTNPYLKLVYSQDYEDRLSRAKDMNKELRKGEM